MRDLRPYIDKYGNISVMIEINHLPVTGFNHRPEVVAQELRKLADEIELAGSEIFWLLYEDTI